MIIRDVARVVSALGFVTALLAACSGGGSKAAPSTTSASLPRTTTTTSRAATTTTAPSACDAGARPATAIRLSQVAGDFDGDDKMDTLLVFGTGTDATPGPWMARVELASGGSAQSPITDAASGDPNQAIRALGATDIGDTAAMEGFVAVGSGASVSLVGIFELEGCELHRLTVAGTNEPKAFPIGGSVTHLDGLRCVPGPLALFALSARSEDGLSYDTVVVSFVASQGELTEEAGSVKATLTSEDPALQRFGQLDCPGVETP